jgi:predicted transcriptional regulator
VIVERLEHRLDHQQPRDSAPDRVTVLVMTAKEQLRERIEALSEREASEALRLLELRTDPVIVAFRDAPVDDEPWTADDEAAVAEGRADVAAGRTVSFEQAFAELDE